MAETNRIPFDLPEAEAELVAGYNVEYSAINFAMFFLAEYTNMLINSFLYVFLFYGMEQRIFSLKYKLSMLDHLKLVIYATGTFLKYSGFHICYLILRCTIGCKLDFEIYDKLFN